MFYVNDATTGTLQDYTCICVCMLKFKKKIPCVCEEMKSLV